MTQPLHASSHTQSGAAPVSRIDSLTPFEAWWVRAIRLCDGEPDGVVQLAEDLTARFGAYRAERLLSRLGDLLGLIADHARRPLMTHHETCGCVGSDEAVLTLFAQTATFGAREDAMMIACLFLRPDVAPLAVSLAQSVGLDLDRGMRARMS
ncbi:hypothetical protein PARPLA_01771 [Rhodobacteraceae bacterium THAF1]|uniref:hypothetical protein n=1 Tax=Palleronia sp. THAF1 TaxID=2587842 RepID=UPI000F3F77E4|nr:hypothetical protein [Palleronia sp. THAF1]QFU09094.1 hypothetical protein FIU81_10450 [Palleronia sp. THAF1]VDC24105.1 hypothetical protein PARPLA_01771 [Rhodobacteraceae bacterium THAF1]